MFPQLLGSQNEMGRNQPYYGLWAGGRGVARGGGVHKSAPNKKRPGGLGPVRFRFAL